MKKQRSLPARMLLGTWHMIDGARNMIGIGVATAAAGVVVGTAAYIAAEQARAEKSITKAVDVYSLGAILYEILTGRLPFEFETYSELLGQLRGEDPAGGLLNRREHVAVGDVYIASVFLIFERIRFIMRCNSKEE